MPKISDIELIELIRQQMPQRSREILAWRILPVLRTKVVLQTHVRQKFSHQFLMVGRQRISGRKSEVEMPLYDFVQSEIYFCLVTLFLSYASKVFQTPIVNFL